MNILSYYNSFISKRDEFEPQINTWANHLIVIFSFTVPILITARRTSFFLLIILFLIRGRYLHYVRSALSDPVIRAFTIYFLVHVVWLIGSDDALMAKKALHNAKFLLFPLLFACFIDYRFTPRILSAFFLGMLTSELISYGIFFEVIPPLVHDISQGTPADPTPLYHHTLYGFMLAVTLVLTLQRIFFHQDKPHIQFLLFFFFVSASANVFITAGRTGYVLYALLLVAMMFLNFRRHIYKPLLAAVSLAVLAFVLAYSFSATFKDRIDVTSNSIQAIVKEGDFLSSIGGRAALLIYGGEVVLTNSFFGLGTGDDIRELELLVDERNIRLREVLGGDVQHTHNEYLRALMQFGFLGLLAFLNIIFQYFRYKNPNIELQNTFRILGVAIMFYTLVDVFVMGLGMLLTVITITCAGLNNYVVKNANFAPFDFRQATIYVGLIALFQLTSLWS